MSESHDGCFEDGGYRVEVKVISQQGTCEFCHQVGDVVVFDGETIQGRICISALTVSCPRYSPCATEPNSPG
ncbi:MAG: hypothetical protein QNL14_06530 [Deltaproteobacteria bacterium]|nr:hypothetical protein [Deltaproteobacteria bacterium]